MHAQARTSARKAIVGGRLYRSEAIAEATVNIVLRGEAPENIPVTEIDPYVKRFDWRHQLRRRGISEASLRADSVVVFREPRPWRRNRGYIGVGLALIIVQAGLIGGLLIHRRWRLAAERVVRSSESALRSSHARVRDLAGRLIAAQEAERTRIARDLHDDACQEVAGVAVDISNILQRGGNIRDASVSRALTAVHRRIADVAESLRLLSHDLHPSVLQHIGLVAALEAHCAEVERQYDVQVSLKSDGAIEPRTPTVALTFFRIAQEALRNAARHGHARHASVTFGLHDGALVLSVMDDRTDSIARRHATTVDSAS